jgi:FKBP-type peptidyl-prolyl cis-trans isomerase SlyD
MVVLTYTIQSNAEAAFPLPRGPFQLQVLIGHEKLPRALEAALLGREEGEAFTVETSADEFFGAFDQDAVVELSLEDIQDPGASPLEVGSTHHVMEGDRLKPFRVMAVNDDTVVADFNHPLAGRTLVFQVRIDEVRWAELEEIKMDMWRRVFH